ncbi:hypothetical protein AGMMS49959_01650 [Planctomycetales bacterium]|nr:hypothetical protein AGMMS49959_01650 [Planctomycetales bacterium]
MNAARHFIAKCRRKGYSDDKIRTAAAGKSVILRDEILVRLAANPADNFAAAFAGDEVFVVAEPTGSLASESIGEPASVTAVATDDADDDAEIADAATVEAIAEEIADAVGVAAADLPVAETPVEDTCVEDTCVEDACVEDASVEDTPVATVEQIDDFPPLDAELAESLAAAVEPESVESENSDDLYAGFAAGDESGFRDDAADVSTDVAAAEAVVETARAASEIIPESIPEITAEIALTVTPSSTATPVAPAPTPLADIIFTIEERVDLASGFFDDAPVAAIPVAIAKQTAPIEAVSVEAVSTESVSAKLVPTTLAEQLAAPYVASGVPVPQLAIITPVAIPLPKKRRSKNDRARPLNPPYAISQDETRKRLESLRVLDVESEALRIDFAAELAAQKNDDWRGAVEDFDDLARPAADVLPLAADETEELRLENARWQRDWQEAADGYLMLTLELQAARETVGARDAQIAQMQAATALSQTAALAAMGNRYDVIKAANENELAELAALRAQIAAAQARYDEREREIATLQMRLEAQQCATQIAETQIEAETQALAAGKTANDNLRYTTAQLEREVAALRRSVLANDRAFIEQAGETRRWRQTADEALDDAAAVAALNADLQRENAVWARQAAAATEALNDAAAINADLQHENTLLTRQAAASTWKMESQYVDQLAGLSAEFEATAARLAQTEAENSAMNMKLETVNLAMEVMNERYEELEREYNVLTNETVPNLQKDKEDLVTLVGDEFSRAEEYGRAISVKSRRSSYAIVAAAAACVAVAITPFFAMSAWETKERELKNAYAEKIEVVEERLAAENQQLLALRDERNHWQAALEQTGAERQTWRQRATNLQTELRSSREEIAQLKEIGAAREVALTRWQEAAQKHEAPAETPVANSEHYNGISGIDEWLDSSRRQSVLTTRAEPALVAADADDALTASVGMVEMKTVIVRRGEGLSQVLWRVCGRNNPKLVAQVARYNRLHADAKGNPVLKVGQEIRVPSAASVAMLTN